MKRDARFVPDDPCKHCRPDCEPLKNIMRLTKDEAFKTAQAFAAAHPETAAFYGFADFKNYYALRVTQDRYLRAGFIAAGDRPKTERPLSFVLEGNSYLAKWFGGGPETRIPLYGISEKHISFTFGDSGAEYQRHGSVKIHTLEEPAGTLSGFSGSYEDFLITIGKYCIEAQLWSDIYINRSR